MNPRTTRRAHAHRTKPQTWVPTPVTCPKCNTTLERPIRAPRPGAIALYCGNCRYHARRPNAPKAQPKPHED
jgi:hypothetical protein